MRDKLGEDTDLEKIGFFSSNAEIANYLLLKYLLQTKGPVGSWSLQIMLDSKSVKVSTATIGRFLKTLDAKGFTKLVGTQGRIITSEGVDYINDLSEKVRREQLLKKMTKAAQPQNLHELLDLYRTRKLLECETARLAALRANSANIQAIEHSIIAHEGCLDNCMEMTATALDFHGLVAHASNTKFLAASLDILYNEELEMESRILEITKERVAEYALQHKMIAKAIKEGNADEAENQMRIHMDTMIAALEEHIEMIKVGRKEGSKFELSHIPLGR